MKLQTKIFRFIGYFYYIATWWILTGCQWIDPCLQEESARHTSPDKIVDTVIIEKNCGATTSINDLVFIVPHGDSVEDYSPVFIADHVVDLEVKWVDKKQLEIRYMNGQARNGKKFRIWGREETYQTKRLKSEWKSWRPDTTRSLL